MYGVLTHRFRRTTLVAVFCAALLAGIGLSRLVDFGFIWLYAGGILLVVFARTQRLVALVLVVAVGLAVGGLRGSELMHQLSDYGPYVDQKITIVGIAAGDGSYDKKSRYGFDLKDAYVVDDNHAKLVGTIGVSGFGENAIFRGDLMQVTGKLRAGTGSHQGWMSFAEMHAVKRDTSWIEHIRHRFGAGMLTALPEPLGSFGMGLLIGQHSTLPDSVYEDLLMVGLVHIIAVSGYNLTIILRAGMRLFGNRSKYQTMLFSSSLIVVFLLLTGSSASIVRASIVSGLSLLAWYYGRAFKPITLILLAAAITAEANPLYVWGDMGWYLSFLAFYGVMVLSPQVRLHIVPERMRHNWLVAIALESLCAEIMTLPLVLFIFGQMSLVSLLANVIVAVFVPLAMLLSVIAGLAGVFLLPIVGWLSWPAVWILTYMLDAAHLLASIPHVFIQNHYLSLIAMLGMYAAVLMFNLTLHSRMRRNSAIISLEQEENLLHMPGYAQTAEAHA
jgi:competence protein ComEC